LGKINLLEGNYAKAKSYFEKTLKQTDSSSEKEYIQKLIDELK